MTSRNATGEGTVYRRKDGRWAGAAYVTTTAGTRKRIYVYGKTRVDVHTRLSERIRGERRGLPTPDRRWTVGAYLEYYMDSVARTKLRRTTLVRYGYVADKYILPALGAADLQRLTVSRVQEMLNDQMAAGASARTLHHVRAFLRSVLSHAEREERVARNVAKLVQLPAYHRKPIEPWGPDEVLRFLECATTHRWYGAFLMLLTYGMRRGEVLGLAWENVDLERSTIQVVTQLQRIDSRLQLMPVKTEAGNRRLPIIGLLHDVLAALPRSSGLDSMGLVFTSANGTPIDPKNFVRTFHQLREAAGLRRITVHHTRHTAATVLKNLGVQARDVQAILGHAHVSTTQQIYQHSDLTTQRQALDRVERALIADRVAVKNDVNHDISTGKGTKIRALASGAPGRTRTYDTWFRSVASSLDTATLTTVSQRLRTRANTHQFGSVAVKDCCQNRPGSALVDITHTRSALRELERERLHRMSLSAFPFSLLDHK